MKAATPARLECIASPLKAAALLNPLRARLLHSAGEPVSATELATRFGMSRQRVNYHVRALARAGLLRRAGRHRKRNMYEQRYIATAMSYVLSPDVIGPAGPEVGATERGVAQDAFSASHLMALTARTQVELARAMSSAASSKKRLSTMSFDAELRFSNAGQRTRFAEALGEAVLGVIALHSEPAQRDNGSPSPGRAYRLLVGCHPIPQRRSEP